MKNPLMRLALEAAVEAGQAILKIYEKEDFGVELKSDASPLTLADRAAQVILKHLQKRRAFPCCPRKESTCLSSNESSGTNCGSWTLWMGPKNSSNATENSRSTSPWSEMGRLFWASFWHRCWVISTSVKWGPEPGVWMCRWVRKSTWTEVGLSGTPADGRAFRTDVHGGGKPFSHVA